MVVDAVAVLMNCTKQALQRKKVAGALLMDVKSAFNNVSRPMLSRRLGGLGIEPDLVRWPNSFMSDREVRLVLEGREGEEHEVETGPTGIPAGADTVHGLPVWGVFVVVQDGHQPLEVG